MTSLVSCWSRFNARVPGRLISLVCRDVTSPVSWLRGPSRGESAWARCTSHRHTLDRVRSQHMVDSFQFCNLARWDEPGFDIFL